MSQLLFKGIGMLVTLAIGAGVYLLFFKADPVKEAKDDAPAVGSCVAAEGPTSNVDLKETDCAEPTATYKVTAEGAKCDKNEVNYTMTVTGSTGSTDPAVELCLTYNVAKGDCVDFPIAATQPAQKVACKGKKGSTTVLKVTLVDAKSASTKCPGKTVQRLPNKTRNSLICFGEV